MMRKSLLQIPTPTVIPGLRPFSMEVCTSATNIGPIETVRMSPKPKPSRKYCMIDFCGHKIKIPM